MEEQKKKTEKNGRTSGNDEKGKLTYEQLNEVVQRLGEQSRNLYQENMAMRQQLQIRRLDVLFRVIENKDCFDSDTIIKCADEIKDSLFPKESEETKDGSK